jgi:uncharacterized protein YqcC (DUF446 family)
MVLVHERVVLCLDTLLSTHALIIVFIPRVGMVLVHERVVLCLDTLLSTHALIIVFVPRVGMVFPIEVSILTLSRVALTVHSFTVVVHVPLA